MEEITRQGIQFDHLVFACGSGGTAAGLGLGARLAGIPSVHAVGVCDSPDYFYSHIEDTARALGVDMEKHGSPREWLSIHHGAGIGYVLILIYTMAISVSMCHGYHIEGSYLVVH